MSRLPAGLAPWPFRRWLGRLPGLSELALHPFLGEHVMHLQHRHVGVHPSGCLFACLPNDRQHEASYRAEYRQATDCRQRLTIPWSFAFLLDSANGRATLRRPGTIPQSWEHEKSEAVLQTPACRTRGILH